MKILMICHYMLPHRGGIEIVVDKLTKGFSRRGHKIIIVTAQVAGGARYEQEGNRHIFRVRALDPLLHLGVHYPIFAPNIISLLKKLIHYVDIVHIQGMIYHNSLTALLLAHTIKRPIVLTEHAGFVTYKNPLLNIIQLLAIHSLGKLALSWSNKIIVHDKIVKEIISSMGIKEDKLVNIPLGVDTSIFHCVSEKRKKEIRQKLGWDQYPKVLFVGNFVARKRINLLLEVLDGSFDLVLCGEGSLPIPQSSKHLLIYPAMDHYQLAEFYQASDLFVVPSKVETFCIVAYEAMACGLPVIMTYDLLHLTIAQSGLVTFVPATPERLREAIHELLADKEKRQEIGLKGAEWVHRHFSWERCIEQHIMLYEQLLFEKNK